MFDPRINVSYENKPLVSQIAETFSQSASYFWGTRKIKIEDGAVVRDKLTFEEHSWQKTALHGLLFIPCQLIATAARTFEWHNAPIQSLISSRITTPFSLPELDFENFSLVDSHKNLRLQYSEVSKKIKTKDDWHNDEIQKEFDKLMDIGYKEAIYIFKKAAERANNDPAAMAKLLVDQSAQGEYVYTFFYSGIVEMYHFARSFSTIFTTYSVDEMREYIEKNQGEAQARFFKGNSEHYRTIDQLTRKYLYVCELSNNPIEKRDQNLFFNPEKLQYRWRMLYNDVCEKIDSYNLRRHLQYGDKRYLSWTRPDLTYVTNQDSEGRTYYPAYPDTRPT